ncbi:MAG: FKBP-type peptidyl-prolyl cis-trans isomerase [Planctomycetota bacterium]
MNAPRLVFLLALTGLPAALCAQDRKIPADTEIVTTASGLKYSVLEAGRGGAHPGLGDEVVVHYTGWLPDGTVFDSSVNRGKPASFRLGQVIEGWNEGLQLMTPGARFKFTIPSGLAYGKRGRPPRIPPDATLIFEVQLISFEGSTHPPKFTVVDPDKTTTTKTGMKVTVMKPGQGDLPEASDILEIRYALWTTRRKLVDCTEISGRTLKAPASRFPLPFLKEAVAGMRPGERLHLEVPPELAFGQRAQGPDLPPGSTTVWELELVNVLKPLKVPDFVMPSAGDLQTTSSGLQYQVIREGSGASPKMGQPVTCHYAGWLTSGKLFDSSFGRGEPSTFTLGRVIEGWNEGLQLMKEGAVYRFVIPAALAYGERGSPPVIPAGATLVFQVELVTVGEKAE